MMDEGAFGAEDAVVVVVCLAVIGNRILFVMLILNIVCRRLMLKLRTALRVQQWKRRQTIDQIELLIFDDENSNSNDPVLSSFS